MKQVLTFLLFTLPFFTAAQCTLEDYQNLLKEAKAAQKSGKYDLAVNKLLAAQECQADKPDKVAEVKKRILEVFSEVNAQRDLAVKNEKESNRQRTLAEEQTKIAKDEKEKAEAETRRIYANDLAFKSQTALRDGNRTTAFRLAEMGERFVDKNNPNILSALADAFYYNEHPDSAHRLPWNKNLISHEGLIASVAFSPDGKRLATGAFDNTAKIWDLENGHVQYTFRGHEREVSFVAFSPDGKKLAIGSWDSNVKIWDSASGQEIQVLSGHNSGISGVAFSPDGKLLATSSSDHEAKIWDLTSGKTVQNLIGHTASVDGVVFSPTGLQVATIARDSTIRIWNVKSGVAVQTIQVGGGYLAGLAISPDGKWLACGKENVAQIWDLESGKAVKTFSGRNSIVLDVCLSPDGKRLATGHGDGTAAIWDIATGKELIAFSGNTAEINCIVFSPDGHRVATGSSDNVARIWNFLEYKPLLVNCREQGSEHTFDFNEWEDRAKVVLLLDRGSIAFSPDGKRIASGVPKNAKAKIWDTENGRELLSLVGHSSDVLCTAFSPNGMLIATGSADGTAKIWDANNGKEIFSFKAEHDVEEVICLAISPDGKLLSIGFHGGAIVWDLGSRNELQNLQGHDYQVSCVAFSPDNKYLATGSQDHTIKLWDMASGKEKITLDSHNDEVNSIAFSPDGVWLASGSGSFFGDDFSIKIWDVAKLGLQATLNGQQRIRSVSFSPDGRWIATGSVDNTARVWDWVAGRIILTLRGHSNFVTSVAFSPDGKRLASSSLDGSLKIWEISTERLVRKGLENLKVGIMTASQLESYNLSHLLDVFPDNETKLLATGETWQIAAFADLYAQKIAQTGFPKKADYERATRLYRACLSHNVDNPYFEKKLIDLEQVWKEKSK